MLSIHRVILLLGICLVLFLSTASSSPLHGIDPTNATVFDTLVIGGGPAGLGVAAGLARLRHTVLVFDSGVYRNGQTKHMHNVLGWDHADPAAFRNRARQELLDRYPTVTFKVTTITRVEKLKTGTFLVVDENSEVYIGRKLALAQGVREIMPDIPGYPECWPQGIFHCLFCEGYEESGGPSAGVLAVGSLARIGKALTTARMVSRLTDHVRIYTNGNEDLAATLRGRLHNEKLSADVESGRIARLQLAAPDSAEVIVTLENGSQFKEAFLAHAPALEVNDDFHKQLNLSLAKAGHILTKLPWYETQLRGVFAVGDAGSTLRAATHAPGIGALAAVGIAQQLEEEFATGEEVGEGGGCCSGAV